MAELFLTAREEVFLSNCMLLKIFKYVQVIDEPLSDLRELTDKEGVGWF